MHLLPVRLLAVHLTSATHARRCPMSMHVAGLLLALACVLLPLIDLLLSIPIQLYHLHKQHMPPVFHIPVKQIKKQP
jgi:hypothetical protein